MAGDPGQAVPRPAAPVSAPLPIGGAFGPPGGVLGPPGGVLGPPGGAFGLPGGAPGGVFGPPGGLPPPPAPMLAVAPGGGFPGAGAPLALPDLQGMARQAMATVVEGAAQPPAVAATSAAPPAPPAPPGPATGPPHNPWHAPPPGRWRAPPPPPPARRHQSGWPAQVVPEERDLAQRIGDRLYPLVERLRDSRLSWVAVVALFGITVPIILLRQSFDVRLRLVLAALTFFVWIGLIQDIG